MRTRRKNMKRLYTIASALILLAGVAIVLVVLQGKAEKVRPRELLLGVETCAECGMVLAEEPHAAQLLSAGGSTANFCDIGCMLIYLHKHHPQGRGVRAMFVHDWATKEWMRAEEAYYVHTRLYTPMYYGFFAFRDRQQAERFAAEGASPVSSFSEALEFARTLRGKP